MNNDEDFTLCSTKATLLTPGGGAGFLLLTFVITKYSSILQYTTTELQSTTCCLLSASLKKPSGYFPLTVVCALRLSAGAKQKTEVNLCNLPLIIQSPERRNDWTAVTLCCFLCSNQRLEDAEMADDFDDLTQSSDTATEELDSPTSGYRHASLLIQKLDSVTFGTHLNLDSVCLYNFTTVRWVRGQW